jgi:hypothetical protein
MKNLFVISLIVLPLSSAFAQHSEGGHGGDGTGHEGGRSAVHLPSRASNAHSVFPAYSQQPRNNGTSHAGPNRLAPPPQRPGALTGNFHHETPSHFAVPVHEDHIGNQVTNDHMNRVQFAHNREDQVMRASPEVRNHVSFHSAAFTGTLHPIYAHKQAIYAENFNHFHNVVIEHPIIWRDWHEHHFFGGFYYGFHPIPDVSIYFYNPLVHWFYIGTWDDHYYRTWYGNEYEAYPEMHHAFPYYGVYYPTDNLRQLLFGVSAMPVDKQARFRDGMIRYTRDATQEVANNSHDHVTLSNGDIVITHYEILGSDDGVDLEGIINHNNKSYNFKGLINLDTANSVNVFVTGNGETAPSTEQVRQLDVLNHSIDEVRGDANPETPPSATPAEEAAPASGEVSADPKS